MEIKYTKNKLGFPGKNVWLIYIFKFRNYIFKPFFLVKLRIFSKNLNVNDSIFMKIWGILLTVCTVLVSIPPSNITDYNKFQKT